MRTTTTLAAVLVVPLLLLACDRADQSPTATSESREKQATMPASPDQTLQRSPPAAGMPAPAGETPATPMPAQPSTTSPDTASPAIQPNEPKKSY